ncbi:hypothetical protein [Rhizohabitans arisaemae]|uniref:hypothetical protein n=1 Tax=Rhizohabitans arisaemae TaxID=2720610 RepID=UPI0024B0F961|nr:hypothetical protein [Rhizohabitans arisaemae]
MRHVFGLIVGAAVAAALLYGAGWAYPQMTRVGSPLIQPIDDTRLLTALGALAGIGLLVGLVSAVRMSPLAAFVPSVVLLSWTVVFLLDMERAAALAPAGPIGDGMQSLLESGIYGLLGIALFIPVLMPSRWSRPDYDDDDDDLDDSDY